MTVWLDSVAVRFEALVQESTSNLHLAARKSRQAGPRSGDYGVFLIFYWPLIFIRVVFWGVLRRVFRFAASCLRVVVRILDRSPKPDRFGYPQRAAPRSGDAGERGYIFWFFVAGPQPIR